MSQDSIQVFENPVESVQVAAEDVTSEEITSLLNWEESFYALWNLVHIEYIIFVCVFYYIIVTRVQAIRTNTVSRRNYLMLGLTIVGGLIGYFWKQIPPLNLLSTGAFINFCYEHIFKWGFKALEKFGWTPLPAWHVEEIKQEKLSDINRAEEVKIKPK